MIVKNKVEYFQNCVDIVKNISGTFVEMGFGKGGSSKIFENLTDRDMWLFDSFIGFPQPTQEDYNGKSCHIKKGDWTVPIKTAEQLQKSSKNKISVRQGFFDETVYQYRGGPIAILHLDCDLYASYKVCLENLYPQVAEGGIILFDEYKSPKQLQNYPGAAKAIDEFFNDMNVEIQDVRLPDKSDNWIKYYMIKGLSND